LSRVLLLPGMEFRKADGPLARELVTWSTNVREKQGFIATHMIVVDQAAYFAGLDARLRALGGAIRDRQDNDHLDLDGLTRQVLIALTLCGRCVWEIGGNFTFVHSGRAARYRPAAYSHRDTQRTSPMFRYSAPAEWFLNIGPKPLRVLCTQLDRYYRSGVWWVDRLSVALGYLWSALTASHPELSFVALCMALEALTSTSQNEITHTLAERCAVLTCTSGSKRIALYREIKDLYGMRSRIVHGRSAPSKGRTLNWETLAITAKISLVPQSALFRMLDVALQVINAALRNRRLLGVLHVKRSEDKASAALNEYFQSLLLCA
jgi:hypothetical protein